MKNKHIDEIKDIMLKARMSISKTKKYNCTGVEILNYIDVIDLLIEELECKEKDLLQKPKEITKIVYRGKRV